MWGRQSVGNCGGRGRGKGNARTQVGVAWGKGRGIKDTGRRRNPSVCRQNLAVVVTGTVYNI